MSQILQGNSPSKHCAVVCKKIDVFSPYEKWQINLTWWMLIKK